MRYSKYMSAISTLIDLTVLNIFFNLGFWILKDFNPECFESTGMLFMLYINVAWIISANMFKVYSTEKHMVNKDIVVSYIKVNVFFIFLFLVFFQIFEFIFYYTKETKQILLPAFFISVVLIRFLLNYMIYLYRKSGRNYRNIVIVGKNDTSLKLKEYFEKNQWTGLRFRKMFTSASDELAEGIGTYNDLENYIANEAIDEIYITLNELNDDTHSILSSITSKFPVKIRFVPDLSKISYMSLELTSFDDVSVLMIKQGPLYSLTNRTMKRVFDLVFSILVIVLLLSWMIPLIWIINRIAGNSGLFFVQDRSGLDNKPFRMIKFRTMRKNHEADSKSASPDDERITRIGRFLRKTSIDEFPQFLNVFVGNMSVVGPRPHMLKHTEEFSNMVNRFMIRHSVKPGITGYAQVSGQRGSIESVNDIEERIKLDINYIQNWSLWMDVRIVLLTVWRVLRGDENAY